VHSTTPKAGILCALAAWLARTPVRLHTFTGQTWATKKGIKKKILRFFDQCIVCLNTQCYADSHSQADFLCDEGVGNKVRIKVLGKGSLAGVDLKRFNQQHWLNKKHNIKQELDIPENAFVIIFIGRLGTEKGIYELMEAFEQLRKKHKMLHLLLIGPCEELLVEQRIEQWRLLSGVHYIGSTNIPEKYLSISDILCLPSYREGFGTVVIEAAAMQVATVGTKITGLVDAVEDKVTGLLVKPKDVPALTATLDSLIQDRNYNRSLGLQAFVRCKEYFNTKGISDLVADEYFSLIKK
jgi:glycosyltransferase involved in cell wall biosynthesis